MELSNNSFEVVAREWVQKKRNKWTEKHSAKVLRSLELNIFPSLGHKPISDITPPELLVALRKIESRGALESAHRVLQRCSATFRYGISAKICESNPASDLKDALETPKTENYKMLSKKELPAFLSALENYDGHIANKLGLQLLIHTFVRTNELRQAQWSEFDFEAKQWTERMKMGAEHIVPLSSHAINILNQLKEINGSYDYVLAGFKDYRKPISNNTLLYAIYRLGYHSRATGRGFRATASTILNEMEYNADAIERQLAHGSKSKVRDRYNRADYLGERIIIMRDWSNLIDSFTSGVTGMIVS